MSLPPHAIDAEENILGAALVFPGAASDLLAEVVPEDFYVPWHREVCEAIRVVFAGGYRVESAAVQLELERHDIYKRVPDASARLVSLAARCIGSKPQRHIREVVECAARRRAMEVLGRARADLEDMAKPIEEVAEQARAAVGTIEMPILDTVPDPDLDAFLAVEDEYDWLVPGLLEVGDRCILTGVEGKGKSYLLRQLAACFAAGVQPFTLAPIDPLRVMILDLENSIPQTRRGLRLLSHALDGHAHRPAAGMLRPVVRTEGIDLLSRADVRWLYERFEANRPQIVVGGPLYKMHAGNPNDEGPAAQVAKVWDVARTRYGFAMVIEAHSPHGAAGHDRDMRPYGASLWRRWPEFGLGLVVDKDDANVSHLRTWRGSRDERSWPTKLRRGGVLPWTVERSRPVPNLPEPELLPGPINDERTSYAR